VAVRTGYFHLQRAHEIEPASQVAPADQARGLRRAALVGRDVGAVHTGFALCELDRSGSVETHVHSTEESFYVLAGNPSVIIDGRTYRLGPNECGLLPVGVPHAWRNATAHRATWLEMTAPAPRLSGPRETFWTGERIPQDHGSAIDIRDPRTRTFFRLGPDEMDVDKLKVGAAADAPTVSASMATALLGYSGIAVKMLVDQRLGAALHSMFMVEYQPGGVALPHDHPFEETYYVLDGEVEAMADGETFTLGPGDILWTGVGCVHAFDNKRERRVRFLETQSPQPPTSYSYRFNRDWDYLATVLGVEGASGDRTGG
jgi:quercetin dioxygenase-like cupin family protein